MTRTPLTPLTPHAPDAGPSRPPELSVNGVRIERASLDWCTPEGHALLRPEEQLPQQRLQIAGVLRLVLSSPAQPAGLSIAAYAGPLATIDPLGEPALSIDGLSAAGPGTVTLGPRSRTLEFDARLFPKEGIVSVFGEYCRPESAACAPGPTNLIGWAFVCAR